MIEGPKWCGKTTTATQHSGSVLRLQDPKQRANYKQITDNDPSLLLEGKTTHANNEST